MNCDTQLIVFQSSDDIMSSMQLPPLNALRVFECVSRHMSFKRAAQELNVTPTAVSHQIRRLEDYLGTKLFFRENRTIRLTRAAEQYLSSVRVAFGELSKWVDRFRQGDDIVRLTVSTLTYVGARWIVQHLASFKIANPRVEVRIMTSTQPPALRRGMIDIGIRRGKGNWPGMRAEWLMNQRAIPVLSPRLLLKASPVRSAEDLGQFTLLHVDAEPGAWRRWFDLAGGPSIDVSHGLTFDQSITAIQGAIDGLGVALGRTPFVWAELSAGLLVAPVPLFVEDNEDFYVVTPDETADDPPIKAFRTWLLSEVVLANS